MVAGTGKAKHFTFPTNVYFVPEAASWLSLPVGWLVVVDRQRNGSAETWLNGRRLYFLPDDVEGMKWKVVGQSSSFWYSIWASLWVRNMRRWGAEAQTTSTSLVWLLSIGEHQQNIIRMDNGGQTDERCWGVKDKKKGEIVIQKFVYFSGGYNTISVTDWLLGVLYYLFFFRMKHKELQHLNSFFLVYNFYLWCYCLPKSALEQISSCLSVSGEERLPCAVGKSKITKLRCNRR